MSYESYFKGKKITVMGLGLLGRNVGDAAFLAEMGAQVTVTDLKTEKELAPALEKLRSHHNISYVLGRHEKKDFEGKDFILKSAAVPFDSPYIAHAQAHGVPVEMSASLFAKLSKIPIIGVTGTRGKTTTTRLIHHILCTSNLHALLGGNIRGVANLPLLKERQADSLAVQELDSWQLRGYGESSMSPHIAVFTNFLPDHMDYYKNDMRMYFFDKANIFKYQTPDDTLVMTLQAQQAIEKYYPNKLVSKQIVVEPIATQNLNLRGDHNKENVACAIAAAEAAGVKRDDSMDAIDSFSGVAGRLQLLKAVRGIKIYNDNNATSPDATIAALKALGTGLILIMGGSDKGVSMHGLLEIIPKHCKKVVLLPGTGTDRVKADITNMSLVVVEKENLSLSIREALRGAKVGDTVLFSPAFASFGMFKNVYDRNDQFVEIVENLP